MRCTLLCLLLQAYVTVYWLNVIYQVLDLSLQHHSQYILVSWDVLKCCCICEKWVWHLQQAFITWQNHKQWSTWNINRTLYTAWSVNLYVVKHKNKCCSVYFHIYITKRGNCFPEFITTEVEHYISTSVYGTGV